ncbi:MAG: GNAT family N-acetyltransferase [Bacilli bacterium]
MNEFSIRRLTPNDLLSASAELQQAFKDYPWEEDWTLAEATSRMEELLSPSNCLALGAFDSHDNCIGVAIGRKMTFNGFSEFILDEFSVSPDYQHQHIGTSLISQLKTVLKEQGVSVLYLVTRKGYGCADFYQHNGMKNSETEIVLEERI